MLCLYKHKNRICTFKTKLYVSHNLENYINNTKIPKGNKHIIVVTSYFCESIVTTTTTTIEESSLHIYKKKKNQLRKNINNVSALFKHDNLVNLSSQTLENNFSILGVKFFSTKMNIYKNTNQIATFLDKHNTKEDSTKKLNSHNNYIHKKMPLEETKNGNNSFTTTGKNPQIYTIRELEKMAEETNFCKINDTGDDYEINLQVGKKELKFLRKKEENLKFLINRILINLKKSEKKKKKAQSHKGDKKEIQKENQKNNEETNNHSSEELKTLEFYDEKNCKIDEEEILSNVISKVQYILLNNIKIYTYKNIFNLQQIYISMRVYNNYPIVPVHVPLHEIENYMFYWVDVRNTETILSSDLFFVPSHSDISKDIQFVIYKKEAPFFYHITEEISVLPDEFEKELSLKDVRYQDFVETSQEVEFTNVLRIITYNVLAPIYTNTEYARTYMFKNIHPQYLETNYRSHLLIHDINFNYDIICLQEVSEFLHDHLFSNFLYKKYYSNYSSKNDFGNDGCSLFVNKNKFTEIDYKSFHFRHVFRENEVREVYESFKKLSNQCDEILDSIKTIYQIGIYEHKNTRSLFLIANTHFYFHSLAEHIRALQAFCLLHIVNKLKKQYEQKYNGKKVHLILNGDFNTSFDSEVFDFIEGKTIQPNSEIWKYAKIFRKEYDNLEKYPEVLDINTKEHKIVKGPTLDRSTFIELKSAYKKNSISFTNWNNNFRDVLDHIFITPNCKVRKVLKGIDESCFEKYKGVLSPIHPSDHIPIAVEIEI